MRDWAEKFVGIEIESKWITLQSAAKYLNVSTSWLYQKGDAEGVPRTRIGRSFRYNIAQLDQWMNRHSRYE